MFHYWKVNPDDYDDDYDDDDDDDDVCINDKS